jgi:hypothetical protein
MSGCIVVLRLCIGRREDRRFGGRRERWPFGPRSEGCAIRIIRWRFEDPVGSQHNQGWLRFAVARLALQLFRQSSPLRMNYLKQQFSSSPLCPMEIHCASSGHTSTSSLSHNESIRSSL